MGIYVDDWSGETDRTRIRGSTDAGEPSPPEVGVEVLEVTLLMSIDRLVRVAVGLVYANSQQSAFVRHPTRPMGAARKRVHCRVPTSGKHGRLTFFRCILKRLQTLR